MSKIISHIETSNIYCTSTETLQMTQKYRLPLGNLEGKKCDFVYELSESSCVPDHHAVYIKHAYL